MKQLFSLLFLFVFVSGLAFAQTSLADFGTADVSGKSKIEAPMAPIVFLSQAPNGVNGLFADSDCQLCPTLQQTVADNVIITTAGPTVGITELVIWGGYYPEDIPNTTDNFTFIIHEDAAGSPGAVVTTLTGVQATTRTQTGVILFGTHEYMFTFDLSATPIMVPTAGTYWLELFNNSVESGNFYWETGTLDASNGILGSAWYTTTPGTSWNLDGATDLSVQINGDDNIGGGGTYGLPEVLYYLFDETGGTATHNYAVPGSGYADALIVGDQTMGPTGQFGSALIGSGSPGNANNVNTGWVPDLGTSDWTISMWLNNLPPGTALNYLFGENTTNSWRCFYSGAAGEYGVLFRTAQIGGTDVTVPGVGPGPSVLTFVYDQTGPTVYSYINGVLVLTTPQAGPLNMTGGTGFFTVGGYNGSTSGGLPIGSFMDEFRFYNRALDAAEVAATWNISIVPVELTSFTASVTGNDVKLLWETATETNNSGFSIERKSEGSQYLEVGFVPGHGTTSEPMSYSFNDQNLRTGEYTYRLKQIDFDGTVNFSDEVSVDVIAPAEFSLDQNYPNPFNPSTKITFSLAADSKVSLKVFDVIGQEVASLINQDLSAGVHNYTFNATGINSGVYFYRIEATGINGTEFVDVKKMILVK